MPTPALSHLYARVQLDPWFLAHALFAWQERTGRPESDLMALFGCGPEGLVAAGLCRMPTTAGEEREVEVACGLRVGSLSELVY